MGEKGGDGKEQAESESHESCSDDDGEDGRFHEREEGSWGSVLISSWRESMRSRACRGEMSLVLIFRISWMTCSYEGWVFWVSMGGVSGVVIGVEDSGWAKRGRVLT